MKYTAAEAGSFIDEQAQNWGPPLRADTFSS